MGNDTQLDRALAITPIADGQFSAVADPNYEANTGMFGGFTAALLLNGVIQSPDASGEPAALTVNYLNRIEPGTALQVHSSQVRAGRSINHWQSSLASADGKLYANASVIMANRKPTRGFDELRMPQAPAPNPEAQFSPPGTFGENTPNIPIEGFPPYDQPHSKSLAWVREKSGRPMDALQIAYLADVYPPRIWYAGKQPVPSATITLSVYFLASSDELAAMGDDYVLSEATGTRAHDSIVGSKLNIWNRQGTLLATSEQVSWFSLPEA